MKQKANTLQKTAKQFRIMHEGRFPLLPQPQLQYRFCGFAATLFIDNKSCDSFILYLQFAYKVLHNHKE